MNKLSLPLLTVAIGLALVPALPALAQGSEPSPRQIQTMIDSGQSGLAAQQLKDVLNQHPDSGMAWFLLAEAQDASGNENAAAQALAKADQYAPGLPFANPQKAAALQAHINNGLAATSGGVRGQGGISPVLLVIGGLIVLFVLLRLFSGVRRQQVYRPYPSNPNAFYGNYPPTGPYGPTGYGPMGGGFGSSIISGLAAGAGFAAGERIVDGMMGGNSPQAMQPQQDFTPGCDDGLMGNPGWDDSGNIDDSLNNNW